MRHGLVPPAREQAGASIQPTLASNPRSAAAAEEPVAAAGDAEAASRQPAHPEDDDDIAMLFGETR